MRFALLLVTLLFFSVSAHAQPGCRQTGKVTPGHIASWATDCVLQDGGTPADPQITGGLGVASGNQQSICTQNAKTGATSQLCLGSTPTGGVLTYSTLGGGSPLPFQFVINGVTYTWPFPGQPINVPFLAATSFGVVADGTTSNDIAMANAVSACSTLGATLWLPPGKILLTGAATITLENCQLIGSGSFASNGATNAGWGTTFLLTSTSVAPFYIGSHFSIEGVNFYWPNQTGAVVYPRLFGDKPSSPAAVLWSMDHVAILNAYDGFVQNTGTDWGGNIISDSILYAVHDLFNMNNITDTIKIDAGFTPGAWLNACNHTCFAAVTAAAQNNHIIHATAGSGLNLYMTGWTFAWRDGFLLDSGSGIGLTSVNLTWDGVATLIDASSGGFWAGGNQFQGLGNCYLTNFATPTARGNNPCFAMGAGSELTLNGFQAAFSAGSFITTAGSNIHLLNSAIGEVGVIADGGDYYAIHATANPGGLVIEAKGNDLFGFSGSTKAHGITTDVAATRTIIQNNQMSFFNDDVNIQSSPTTNISGNWSISTQGSSSILISGTNPVMYANNLWDKPPVAAVSACGPGATITGAFNGVAVVGSTNPTSSCTITLPWIPYGVNAGLCLFGGLIGTPNLGANFTLTPLPQWTIVAGSDFHNGQITFQCPGQQ
jgi:hypothetical protein